MAEMFTSEAKFMFISVERGKCGYSCCNMVMLIFYWLLYQTSFHDQNQSKLCSNRICYLCWEPLACCQYCSLGGGGCRAMQFYISIHLSIIYIYMHMHAILSVGKNNFFWYNFFPVTDMFDWPCFGRVKLKDSLCSETWQMTVCTQWPYTVMRK